MEQRSMEEGIIDHNQQSKVASANGKVVDFPVQQSKANIKQENKQSVLDERSYGKPIRRHVEEFGCVFGFIFCLIGSYQAYYNGNLPSLIYWFSATVFLIIASYRAPLYVYPLWKGWMAFAHALGMVMSFLFVSITWLVVAIPIALLLRVIGKHVMDLRYGAPVDSYWEERPEKLHDFQLLERQF